MKNYTPDWFDDLPTEWPPEPSLNRKLTWNSERLPNTHGSRMKILRWTMKEWSKKVNPPMDTLSGREFMNDEDWVMDMIDVCIPDNGKNSMTLLQRRRANHLFKKYGGSRKGLDFTK